MTRRFAVLALPLFALTVVACGDDDKTSSPSRAATATKGDAFCTAAEGVDELSDAMSAVMASGDPVAFEASFDALIASAKAAEQIAPTDIAPTIAFANGFYEDLQVGLEKYGWDINAMAADPEYAALLQSEEVETNGNELDTYLSDKCGIAPG